MCISSLNLVHLAGCCDYYDDGEPAEPGSEPAKAAGNEPGNVPEEEAVVVAAPGAEDLKGEGEEEEQKECDPELAQDVE